MKHRILLRAATLALGATLTSPAVHAQAQSCSEPYAIEQRFPTTGVEETRWRLCWQVVRGNGLIISGAWFRPAPNAAWIKLVYDARLAELFVPYHGGSPRYYDVGYNFGWVPLDSIDCPPTTGGLVLGTRQVCKQVHDRGLAWKHDAQKRRGEELVLFSVLAAANYNYIIEWTFRDDGTMAGRVGATGIPAGTTTHMHGPVWRLDLDLNGADGDQVTMMTHTESGALGVDTHTPIVTEGGFPWSATGFRSWELTDATLRNSAGAQSAWHLMPQVTGTPMHQEPFTTNTLWVTHYRWNEFTASALPTYVNGESVRQQDVVLWYYGGLHHMVRGEDAQMTHVMWTGFSLMPFNVFGKTPLFP